MPQSPIREYLRILRRQLWLIVLVLAVALVAAAYVTSTREPVYRASMKILVAESAANARPEFAGHATMQTMRNILQSQVVARSVVDGLDLEIEPDELLRKLTVAFGPDTSVLEVSFDWGDREEAVDILSRVAQVYDDEVDETLGVGSDRPRASTTLPIIVTEVFDPPHAEEAPVSPRTAQTLGFAGALGLALGLLLAIARESIDDRIRAPKDAAEWFGAPVLASLPRGVRGKPPPGVGAHRPTKQHRVDALHLLRVNLLLAGSGSERSSLVVVTSASSGDGKSTVAANLAVALASAGKDVICVDADLRRPTVHRYLGTPATALGLADVVEGHVALARALQTVPLTSAPGADDAGTAQAQGRLRVLTAGRVRPDPGGVLTSEATSSLIEELRSLAAFVIVDVPPLSLPDAYSLVVQADDVLVVARRGRTTRDRAQLVRATLEGLGAQRVGVVLTDAARDRAAGYPQIKETA